MTLNPSARDLRLGVLIAALLVAAVILASAWSDWLAARKTAAALVLGEGEQLGALLRHALADVPRQSQMTTCDVYLTSNLRRVCTPCSSSGRSAMCSLRRATPGCSTPSPHV